MATKASVAVVCERQCGGSSIQMEHAVLAVNLLSGLVNKGRFLFFFYQNISERVESQSLDLSQEEAQLAAASTCTC